MTTANATQTPRLDEVSREWMIRGAHFLAARRHKRHIQLWSFVGTVCSVGSTTATRICRELGWEPNAPAERNLPFSLDPQRANNIKDGAK